MTKERFYYLMNTLPWNLSREDQKAAAQLRKDVQPAIDIAMLELYKRYEGLDKIFDGVDRIFNDIGKG